MQSRVTCLSCIGPAYSRGIEFHGKIKEQVKENMMYALDKKNKFEKLMGELKILNKPSLTTGNNFYTKSLTNNNKITPQKRTE